MTPQYRKRGSEIVVEAMQLTEENALEVSAWSNAQSVQEREEFTHEVSEALNVPTPYGNKRASQMMYVVRFKQSFYVVHRNRFEAQYEPLDIPTVNVVTKTRVEETFDDPYATFPRFGQRTEE